MKKKIIIIGAGGHARSVIDIALQNDEFDIVGCIDYNNNTVLGINVIGNDDDLKKIYDSGIKLAFVALGDNKIRNTIYNKLDKIGFDFVNIISRNAFISERTNVGRGICIMAGAVINVNCAVKDNCIINTNCCIDHDCVIEKSCHIAPGVSMSGTVCVGEGTHIGTGSNIIDKINIGKWSYVGAGTTVVKDIPNEVMVYGTPAKIISKFGKDLK